MSLTAVRYIHALLQYPPKSIIVNTLIKYDFTVLCKYPASAMDALAANVVSIKNVNKVSN
jgi:hypothetical protein